ncbi:MAG: peptidoglycan-binding protein [Propionibacteriaceae bacterium]|jgi:peptidoglycan hydrolase-like protein with peptidoglycan-binding domain|nr:peptidoglycan-binding protein [Propionibacteriaceae bacterium]
MNTLKTALRFIAGVRRHASLLVTVVLVVLAVAAGWWAGRMTLTGAVGGGTDENRSESVNVSVVAGAVGRSLSIGVSVRQPMEVVATNTLYGMVTMVAAAGEASTGDVVFQVAGVPVRVVPGAIPFYRNLSREARGVDVAQLNAALVELGYLSVDSGDYFGTATYNAVRAWQQVLGVERTGTVLLGEVLAVPSLPATIRLGDDICTGRLVSGGEAAVLANSGALGFVAVLSDDQAAAIATDVVLRVYFEDLMWEALVTGSTIDSYGYTVRTLSAPDGGLVCGADCARLPADEQLSLRAEAVVVPEVSGMVVPVGAVRTDAVGRVYVRLAAGGERDVTVLGSGQGLAVLSGVTVGDEVVVYG